MLLYVGDMNIRIARPLLGGAACAGAVLLISTSVQAQNLFVANFGNGEITEITPGEVQSTFASGLMFPIGLAFDKAGNLFVGNYNGIDKFTRGVQSTFATGVGSPFGLAFDSAGNLFASDQGNPGNIYKITPSGVVSNFASGLNSPLGLAFNRAGVLFEADYGSGNIYEFTADGVQSTFPNGPTSLVHPDGLAFDGAGNLFVTDNGSGNIYEFTPGGVQSTFATGFSYLNAIAFDSASNLFVSAGTNIVEFTLGGAKIFGTAAGTEGFAFQPMSELQAGRTNGAFQVTVSMPSPYYSTIIQASTDLVNWVNIYTNTPPFTFTNSMATTLPYCFYRAVLGP